MSQSDLLSNRALGQGTISQLAFDDSGEYLAAVLHTPHSRTVTLWEVATRTMIKSYRVPIPAKEALTTPTRISFVNAPLRIQVESPYSLETWEIKTDRYERIELYPQEYTKDLQEFVFFRWGASGKYLVSGRGMGWSGLIAIEEPKAQKLEMIELNFPPAKVAISDDDSIIAAAIGKRFTSLRS